MSGIDHRIALESLLDLLPDIPGSRGRRCRGSGSWWIDNTPGLPKRSIAAARIIFGNLAICFP
jgi:hypothetical protein